MLSVVTNIQNLSDEQLLVRYRQGGDRNLIGELYRRYHHLVFGACLNFLGDKEASSDMVLQIFEKLIQKLATEEVHNFNSWIYSICRNECFSYLRRQKTEAARQKNWAEDENSSEIFMENEALLRLSEEEQKTTVDNDPDERVRRVLEKLPPGQRICITLFYIKEYSYQQIAEQTRYSLLQVKSYLQNGKRNLKLLLQAEDP